MLIGLPHSFLNPREVIISLTLRYNCLDFYLNYTYIFRVIYKGFVIFSWKTSNYLRLLISSKSSLEHISSNTECSTYATLYYFIFHTPNATMSFNNGVT